MADNSFIENTNVKENLVKVHIDAFQPHTVIGGVEHAMSYVKQITTSSDFDEMSEAKRQCQNKETVTECASKLINGGAADHCGCVPWVLTGLEEMRRKRVCQPEGSKCFAKYVAMNTDIVKSNCSVNCRGLYLDVEKKNDMDKLISIDDDGVGKNDLTFNLFEEYRRFRNPEMEFFRDVSADAGWPFKTSQNVRVPLYTWICPGPEKPKLPKDCSLLEDEDGWPTYENGVRFREELYHYCIREFKKIHLTIDNCTNHDPENLELSKMCEEQIPLWGAGT